MTAHEPVRVPRGRFVRWVHNFGERHGTPVLTLREGLHGESPDGSWFLARLPFDREYDGSADPHAFSDAAAPPEDPWGLLLVRKGGFAVARLSGERIEESKVGQRHVQGRTKAGGQSQQRFARRRENQARAAYEAAADHAARILEGTTTLVTGGDHGAVEAVLSDRRLEHLRVVRTWLAVPDPRRGVLEQAAVDATSVLIHVHNA